jgi:hypothetical protein
MDNITIKVDENSAQTAADFAAAAQASADAAALAKPIDSLSIADVPDGVGLKSWNAVEPGTYPNCGGIVIPESCFAIIKRDAAGAFSFTKTDLDTGKLNVSDVIDELDSTETEKALSAAQGKALNEKFKEVKTYNLIDVDNVLVGKLIQSNGIFADSVNHAITPYIPVIGNKEYWRDSEHWNKTVFYYDANKIKVSQGEGQTNVITTPADALFMVYYVDKDNFANSMLVEGNYAKPYIPYGLPVNTDYYAFKSDAFNKEVLNINQNDRFGNLKDNPKFTRQGLFEETIVNNPFPILTDYGIERLAKIGVNSGTPLTQTFVWNYGTPEAWNNRYVYVSLFVVTTQTGWTPTFNNYAIHLLDASSTYLEASILSFVYTEIQAGIFKIDITAKMQDSTASHVRIGFRNLAVVNSIANDFYTSGIAFGWSDDFYENISLITDVVKGGKKHIDLNRVVSSNYEKVETEMTRKKWVLFGTSIEEGGYFDEVAKAYQSDYINHGNSGGGILWSNDQAIADTLFNHPIITPQKAWSATWEEKEAYLIANSIAIDSTSEGDCYDKNLLTNLDADLFIIGTYGVNDRKSGNSSAFVIDKVNRQFDRTTIYGAYSYIFKKLLDAKPTARILILGQPAFGVTDQNVVNNIQREVARDWNIKFIDWGYELGFSYQTLSNGITGGLMVTTYSDDGLHPNSLGKKIMGDYLIRKMREIV